MISQISLTIVSYLVHCGWIMPILALIGWSFERILITSRPKSRFQIWAGIIILSVIFPLAVVQVPVSQTTLVPLIKPAVGVVKERMLAVPPALVAGDLKVNATQQTRIFELPKPIIFALAGGYAALFLWWVSRILVGVYQVQRFRKTLKPVELTEPLRLRLSHCSEKMNVPLPLVLSDPATLQPFTFGIFRPAVVIPQTIFESTTPELLESVFAHELAHIRRHDFGFNLVLELGTAFCVFHPVIWLIRRRLFLHREAACDEMVTGQLIDPLTFAQSLLTVADTLSNRHALTPGMFHANTLEERIMSLTNSVDRTRKPKISLVQRLSFGLVLSFGIGAFGLIPALIPTLAETQSPQSPQGESVILRQRSPAGTLKRTNAVGSSAEEAFHKQAVEQLLIGYEQVKLEKSPQLYFACQLRRINSTQAQVICLLAGQVESNWLEIKVDPGKLINGPDGKPVIGENGLAQVNSDGPGGMIRTRENSSGPTALTLPVTPSITFEVQPDTDHVVINFSVKKEAEPTKLVMRLDNQNPTSGAIVVQ